MKVIQIVKAHLVANGFDGLLNEDAECGCLVEDLRPCGDDCSDCRPGYKGADESGESDWAIYSAKERALEADRIVAEWRERGALKGGA
jgi:hypothetical protein